MSAAINGGTLDDLVEEARRSADQGFDTFWVSQIFGHDSLNDWPGAIILVSHDTEFVEQLAPTKVLLMPEGQLDFFAADWLDLVALA